MAGKPYPVQRYAHPPAPGGNMNYAQPPYNPAAYPPQSSAYPPQPGVMPPQSAAYPPQQHAGYPPQPHPGAYPTTGPPPPYYPSDPYSNHPPGNPPAPAAYPQQVTGYPTQQYAAYPQGVQATGSYDSSARFGAGATHNIPPPPPGVMPNAAQVASMQGQSVHMNQKPAGFFEGHSSGGSTFW